MSTQTLYEIGADIEALETLLFEMGGDVTDEDVAAAVDAWLAENTTNLRAKLDGYGALIREREAHAEARRKEADRLYGLAQTDTNLVRRLKERLLWFFDAQGLDRLETLRFKFSVAQNGGKAPVHLKVEPHELPEWAKRVSVAPDMESIRTAVERGDPDALALAELGQRGKHLRVR